MRQTCYYCGGELGPGAARVTVLRRTGLLGGEVLWDPVPVCAGCLARARGRSRAWACLALACGLAAALLAFAALAAAAAFVLYRARAGTH